MFILYIIFKFRLRAFQRRITPSGLPSTSTAYNYIHDEYTRLRNIPAQRADAITTALGTIDFAETLTGMNTFLSESDNMLD
jgi:hypothetical protein